MYNSYLQSSMMEKRENILFQKCYNYSLYSRPAIYVHIFADIEDKVNCKEFILPNLGHIHSCQRGRKAAILEAILSPTTKKHQT